MPKITMYKALAIKELRESAAIIAVAALAMLWLLGSYIGWKFPWANANDVSTHIPFVSSSFVPGLIFIGGAAAIRAWAKANGLGEFWEPLLFPAASSYAQACNFSCQNRGWLECFVPAHRASHTCLRFLGCNARHACDAVFLGHDHGCLADLFGDAFDLSWCDPQWHPPSKVDRHEAVTAARRLCVYLTRLRHVVYVRLVVGLGDTFCFRFCVAAIDSGNRRAA